MEVLAVNMKKNTKMKLTFVGVLRQRWKFQTGQKLEEFRPLNTQSTIMGCIFWIRNPKRKGGKKAMQGHLAH